MSRPLPSEVVHLVLRLRHDHRHVGLFHVRDLLLPGPRARSAIARLAARPVRSARCVFQYFCTLSYIRTAVALSMRHDHRLALVAAPHEVRDDVRGDLVQPVVAGDQVVLAGELALQLLLLLLVQFGVLEQLLHVVVQVLVGELQFGDAVLVVQRDRRAVLDRLPEVVDADVVAEDLARPLLARHQRRAGEADERGVRQGVAHVQGERVVLAAVRLVGDHDDVRPVRQLRDTSRPCSVRNFWISVKT